jgi:hypothetical protein
MPDLGPDKTTATTYPSEALYEQWSDHAEDLNIPISQFLIRMVEAGRKQIDLSTVADNSLQELRQQRADLRSELEQERQRVQELERQLYRTAQSDIVDYVKDNPGATTPEIMQHIADTVPGRVASHLDALEDDKLDHRNDGFYPRDTSSGTPSAELHQTNQEETTE